MRFALLSVIELKGVDFTSLIVYQTDENGISNCIAEITKPYDISDLLDDLIAYNIEEIQTDSQAVYRELVSVQFPVIYRKQVEGTRELVEYSAGMLIELFELDKAAIVIPRWRLFIISKLEKIIQILKTKGIKKDGN